MVEQTRHPRRVVSLQAGPGEVGTSTMNLRVNDRAVRAVGRQLAVIGDQLDREWATGRPNLLPAALHMLRPAQALTRTIYRDIQSQMWGFQGLTAAVKAWIESAVPGQGIFRADIWASMLKPAACTGWTGGALLTMTLVAAVAIFGIFWKDWRGP